MQKTAKALKKGARPAEHILVALSVKKHAEFRDESGADGFFFKKDVVKPQRLRKVVTCCAGRKGDSLGMTP